MVKRNENTISRKAGRSSYANRIRFHLVVQQSVFYNLRSKNPFINTIIKTITMSMRKKTQRTTLALYFSCLIALSIWSCSCTKIFQFVLGTYSSTIAMFLLNNRIALFSSPQVNMQVLIY